MRISNALNPAHFTHALGVNILRHADGSDCTMNGVSSRHTLAYLVGPGIAGPHEVSKLDSNDLVLYLHKWTGCDREGVSFFASPSPDPHEYMFGGNFCATSDSRFPSNGAIKIHDRDESGRLRAKEASFRPPTK